MIDCVREFRVLVRAVGPDDVPSERRCSSARLSSWRTVGCSLTVGFSAQSDQAARSDRSRLAISASALASEAAAAARVASGADTSLTSASSSERLYKSAAIRVECSKSLSSAFPVGTQFKIKAKLTDREDGGEFLYSYFGWKPEVFGKVKGKTP
jgi:hypothetical protein